MANCYIKSESIISDLPTAKGMVITSEKVLFGRIRKYTYAIMTLKINIKNITLKVLTYQKLSEVLTPAS